MMLLKFQNSVIHLKLIFFKVPFQILVPTQVWFISGTMKTVHSCLDPMELKYAQISTQSELNHLSEATTYSYTQHDHESTPKIHLEYDSIKSYI